MLGLYNNKDVQKLVRRLREEYDEVMKRQQEVVSELKEQNRILLARVSQLEVERDSVSDAIVHAVAEGERIKRECALEAANERKELALLAEKCRVLGDKMSENPETGDGEAYSAFLHKLHDALDESSAAEEAGAEEFNMDEVLAPKEPLNLERLCLDLGLMEDDGE